MIANNYYLRVNSATDLSAYLESMEIKYTTNLQEFVLNNPGGALPLQNREHGVQDINIACTFKEDTGAGGPSQTLRALFGTSFQVDAALNGSTESAANPVFRFTGTFAELPFGGQAGSHLQKQITFVLATGAVTVDITP